MHDTRSLARLVLALIRRARRQQVGAGRPARKTMAQGVRGQSQRASKPSDCPLACRQINHFAQSLIGRRFPFKWWATMRRSLRRAAAVRDLSPRSPRNRITIARASTGPLPPATLEAGWRAPARGAIVAPKLESDKFTWPGDGRWASGERRAICVRANARVKVSLCLSAALCGSQQMRPEHNNGHLLALVEEGRF